MQISAQVVLAPSHVQRQREIAEYFVQAGFSTGPLAAGSFPISGDVEIFERFFEVKFNISSRGEFRIAGASGDAAFELPLDRLRQGIREGVQHILFTRLPDFGPFGQY